MRTFKLKKTLAIGVALLSVGSLPYWGLAQEAEGKARIGDTEGKASVEIDRTQSERTIATAAERHTRSVTDVNKASKIIGMEVKNHRGELLGEIQDLVIDLESGKVSYAVLASGGFLGLREKYLAIPINALSRAVDDNDMLVMNVEKSSIQAATGFAKNNWPSLDSPAWGAGLSPEELRIQGEVKGRGLSDSDRVDQERMRASGTLPQQNRFDTDRESVRTGKYDRDSEKGSVFRGRITALNLEKRTITVEGDSGSQTFTVAERPVLALKENRNPSLADLRVGHPVAVGYHVEGDSHIAHSIMRTDAPEVK